MSLDPNDGEIKEVAQLFIQLGATSEQATVMASQLLKRAEQLAHERGISKIAALEDLLKHVVEARRGA